MEYLIFTILTFSLYFYITILLKRKDSYKFLHFFINFLTISSTYFIFSYYFFSSDEIVSGYINMFSFLVTICMFVYIFPIVYIRELREAKEADLKESKLIKK